MNSIKSSLKFDNKIVLEVKGSAGGLCMIWKNGLTIKSVEHNKNMIAIKISKAVCDWLLVGFYGPAYHSKKKKAWENLFALLESHQGPWVCLGDFNFMVNDNETSGSSKGGSSTTNYLKELMAELGAIDLGFTGSKFTWAKGKWGNAPIKRRLDRGVASISWRLAFPKASIAHLGAIKSYHAPILLDTIPSESFALGHFTSKQLGLEIIGVPLLWRMRGKPKLPDQTLSSFIKSKLPPEMHFESGTRKSLANAKTK